MTAICLKFLCLLVLSCSVSSFPLQPASRTNSQKSVMMLHAQQRPELIVFDLDNTLWTPELYQLRKIQRENRTPVAGQDVHLMEGTQQILSEWVPKLKKEGVQFGVASRTKSVEWAHALLGQFGLTDDVLSYVQIFPGNKQKHFQHLRDSSGIDFSKMLFFDDARDGKFGNCEPVAEMGVLAVHCPKGLNTIDVFTTALERFNEWDGSPGKIVEHDGTLQSTSPQLSDTKQGTGIVKKINRQKRYGFITFRKGKSRDLFFHFNNLNANVNGVEEGDEVSFQVQRDSRNGKLMAADVQLVAPMDDKKIHMRCFSMNMPFAGLLANGYKTLETRNGTMFEPYTEGTHMLLHVGRRTYPDGDKHIEIMKSGELNEQEIADLKKCPQGFGRGNAIAIVELGRTYETTLVERCDPEFQRKVGAFGADSGRMVTEIKRVAYLNKPVRLAGQGGVFKVQIDPRVIPEGWSVPVAKTEDSALYASISG